MLRTGFNAIKEIIMFTAVLLYCGTSTSPLWSQSKGNEIGFQALELEAEHGFVLSPEDMQFYRNLIDKTVQAINDAESVDRTDGYSKGEAITILQTIDTTIKELGIRGEYFTQSELYSESIRDRNFDCDKYVLTYLTIAQIAGLPLQAIVVPEHIFVTWKDSQLEFYWEATSGGSANTMEWIVPQDNKYQAAHDIKLKTLNIPEYLATTYMNLGIAYSENESHDLAIEMFSSALLISSDLPEIFLNRANSYAARGQHESAIQDYSTALRLNPYIDDAYSSRARAHLFTEQYQKSINDCTEALELNKDNIEAHYFRGKANLQLDELDKAKDDLDRVLELDPGYCAALFELGELNNKSSNVNQALSYWTQAIGCNKLLLQAYLRRASAYADMKDYPKAIEDFNQVLLSAPKNVTALETNESDIPYLQAYYNRAVTYLNMEEYQKAIEDFNQVLLSAPKNVTALETNESDIPYLQAYYNRAVTYLNMEEYQKAIEDFNQVLLSAPKNVTALESNESDIPYLQAYYNRAITYLNMEEYQKAIEDFNQVLLLNPANVDALWRRGRCYDEMGQKDKAITDYLAAIKGGSKEMLVFYNLGVLYYNRGMLKEACGIWSQGKSLGLVECEDEYERRCTNQQ